MENREKITICDTDNGAVISVKVIPGASRDRIVGVLGDCLKVATSQPAEKGKANKAVAAILAKALGASRKDVTLLSGSTNPRKEFRIAGLTTGDVQKTLANL